MTEWVLYLDESGSNDHHHLPMLKGETPVFTVAGVTLPCERWREYDREFLYLKREFFKAEIDRSSTLDTGWEAKGNYLLAPRNSDSVRNRVFVDRVIDIIRKYNGRIIGVSFIKNADTPMSRASMYTKGFQIIAERYDTFLREINCTGLMIADSRMAHLKKGSGLDYTVAISYLSYIFGHIEGRQLVRIIEAPLFADSKLTVGLQIADIVAMMVYTNAYRTKIPFSQDNQDGYVDYSHTEAFYPKIRSITFESDRLYAGRKVYGLRTIDHRIKAE